MNKWILTLLLAALSALPAAAQINNGGQKHGACSGNTPLSTNAQQGASSHKCPVCSNGGQCPVQAPAQQTGENSNNLNVQVERAVAQAAHAAQQQDACSCGSYQTEGQPDEPEIPAIFTQEEGPLSTRELIAAEEELSLIRNRKDNQATFEKYPYLLDPAYRRAGNDAPKNHLRTHYGKDKPGQFTPPYSRGQTWADKVGL